MLDSAPYTPFTTAFRSAEPIAPERTCRQITTIVAADFGIASADIESMARGSRKAAFARQIAMYLAHVGFGLGFTQIGKFFGRDRTTVAHACRVVEDRRDEVWFECRIAALEFACRAFEGGAQ